MRCWIFVVAAGFHHVSSTSQLGHFPDEKIGRRNESYHTATQTESWAKVLAWPQNCLQKATCSPVLCNWPWLPCWQFQLYLLWQQVSCNVGISYHAMLKQSLQLNMSYFCSVTRDHSMHTYVINISCNKPESSTHSRFAALKHFTRIRLHHATVVCRSANKQ